MDWIGEESIAYIASAAVTAGLFAAVYWQMGVKSLRQQRMPVDLNKQSVEVPNIAATRMSTLCPNGQLIEKVFSDVGTFYEAFQRGKTVSDNGPCLGKRPGPNKPYVWLSYKEVYDQSLLLGSVFLQKMKPPNSIPRTVGIYAQNKVEYVFAELACSMYSLVLVPLYDTLGAESCTYIIKQAVVEVVVCDKNSRLKTLLDNKAAMSCLKAVICVDELPTPELLVQAQAVGVEIIDMNTVQTMGGQVKFELKPAKPDDLYMICYTSGTTGLPKGAMVSHKNLLAVVNGIHLLLTESGLKLGTGDVLFSYLPLAHIYEQMTECYVLMNGAQIGFYQGDVKLLLEDLAELRPTLLPTVPRLLNRIYDKVMGTVNSSFFLKKILFKMGLNAKMKDLSRGVVRDNTMWDKLVFSKVRQSLGGRLKLVTTGSAPLSATVMSFVRCALGCTVIEGYGQTECGAVCALQVPGCTTSGHVGPPLPCNQIRLVDVPEMNYYAAQNQGEVCLKGANVFRGYLGLPDKTAEALDSDGWLHTGDIGQWQSNGELKIIDRKKHIFKLAQGEYVAPEKVEMVYARVPGVAQVFVHGDSLKASTVGIIVPDPESFPKWALAHTRVSGTMEELCRSEVVKKELLATLTAAGKKAGLNSFEQVKAIHMHPELFSLDNDMLTPTFKIKRAEVKQRFGQQLAAMYERLD